MKNEKEKTQQDIKPIEKTGFISNVSGQFNKRPKLVNEYICENGDKKQIYGNGSIRTQFTTGGEEIKMPTMTGLEYAKHFEKALKKISPRLKWLRFRYKLLKIITLGYAKK